MLAAQRKELLLDRLRVDGRLVAKDLATELDTSEDTIRRDLRELADAGLCQRVYGGAIPIPPAAASYARRQEIATTSKQPRGPGLREPDPAGEHGDPRRRYDGARGRTVAAA